MSKAFGNFIQMSNQLILKFPKNKIYLREDFYVSSSNQEAYDFINSWPKWIKRIANIFGPSGSGKSHLVSILEKKTSTLIVQANELNDKMHIIFHYAMLKIPFQVF